METPLQTKSLDHLGLVSGMYDELGLGACIDNLLQSDTTRRDVSIGTLCKALVLNGLGFVQRTLYMVSSFFEGKPIEVLLGEGIEASQLNDSVLGRALDDLHVYGCTRLFSQLTPLICEQLGLTPRFVHMDTTDFHLDGEYNAEQPPAEGSQLLHLTKGYSRDHRPDLNQVVLNLIADNQAGIPLHMEALDGNSSDKISFRETIATYVGQLQNAVGFTYLVMDSAGYTQETIAGYSEQVKWISRVPETLSACQALLTSSESLTPLIRGYHYQAIHIQQAGVKQRWLVFFSEEAYQREIKTLRKTYQQRSLKEYRAFLGLSKQPFACEQDAITALKKFAKQCNYLQINALPCEKKPYYRGKGRPARDSQPTGYHYHIRADVSSRLEDYQQAAHRKGKFVIATNELDEQALPDVEVLLGYKGQAKVERGFRFLKDPQFIASSLFVKKPERVEALLFIMTLCLTVYAALEHRLRQQLQEQEESLPNQLGKPTQKPTMRWVFALFNGIHVLYGMPEVIVLNLKPIHLKVLTLMGDSYKKCYSPSG
jgi:transposase